MNVTRFGIVDPECFIRSVLISFIKELAVQGEDIVGQMKRKSFDVFAARLISEKGLEIGCKRKRNKFGVFTTAFISYKFELRGE